MFFINQSGKNLNLNVEKPRVCVCKTSDLRWIFLVNQRPEL